jgi:hypothetical protein
MVEIHQQKWWVYEEKLGDSPRFIKQSGDFMEILVV